MTLTHSDVHWCSRSRENVIIVDRCGEFPNVSLIGTKGCINYNLVLSYLQLGYAMDGRPKVEEVSELVYFVRGSDPVMLKRVTSAWKGIHKKDRTTLGQKVPIARCDTVGEN